MPTESLLLPSEQAQVAFGAELASICGKQPMIIYLSGDLGAGKTTLARGFLRGLGHEGAVKSPTYTLIEPYALTPVPVYHLDLYRVADPAELEYLGLRDILEENAILLIEWPERGEGWLPAPDLALDIRTHGDGRAVRIGAQGARGRAVKAQLLAKLRNND
jgi:tRNA threonylcarbamoyladenosine biosynthesis protein TsaE